MYDGLSRKDMQVILAFSVYLRTGAPPGVSVPNALMVADQFLNNVEQIEAAREVKFCEFGEGDE